MYPPTQLRLSSLHSPSLRHPSPRRGEVRWGGIIATILCTFIAACTTPLPTSERLEAVKARRLAGLKQEIISAGFTPGAPISINIYKKERLLEIWMAREKTFYGWAAPELYKTYPICTYSGTLGPKLREGDMQTPEGFYAITRARLNPWSRYHLSMDIGYPNARDRALGRTGSHIMIHGDCVSEGCFAMTDPVIEDIYLLAETALKNGAIRIPVSVYPLYPPSP
jgi:murein L,D-transpeptidase YafK